MKLKQIMRDFFFFREKDHGVYVGRRRTHDTSFQFRMGAGFQGAVNRSHPVTIEPCMVDTTSGAPPTYYGQAVVADGAAPNGVRVPKTGDAAAAIYGFTVRPYPIQQTTGGMSAAYGVAVPPTNQPIDVMRSGYMIVLLQGAAPAFKGSLIQVNTIAGAGYLVGGVSVDTVAGTFVQLDSKSSFNGPADSAGLVEIAFNI
jgi:hypothetical protein